MKVFVAIFSVVCTLVIPSKLLASDWFDIFISRDTIELNAGETLPLNLSFIQHDSTFDATLFLGAGIGDYMFLGADGIWKTCMKETSGSSYWLKNPPILDIPTNAVNKPYTPVSCSIKSNQADTGFYRIYIKISISNRLAKDSLYVRVKPMQNWYLVNLIPKGGSQPLFASCLYVTQDTTIHNYFLPAHEHTIGSGDNIRRLIYTGSSTLENSYGVTTFAFNRKKQMWVEANNGLQRIDKYYTTLYNKTNSEFKGKSSSSNNWVISVESFNNTQYWRNDAGLFSILDGVLTDVTAKYPNVFSKLAIGSIYCNPNINNTYISTRRLFEKADVGIYKYDGEKWDSISVNISGLSNDSILGIYELKQDKLNNLWAIIEYWHYPETAKQLVMYNGKEWMQFPALDSIPLKGSPWFKYEPHVVRFEFEMHGDIWLVTGFRQLVQFDGREVKRIYNSENSPLKLVDLLPVFVIDSSNTFYFSSDSKGGKYLQMFNPDGIPLPLMSQPSAVEEEIQPPISGITISPNPTSTSLTISGIEGVRSMQMVNTLGMVVGYESLGTSSTHEVDVSNLPNGMYSMQFRTETGIISKPVVVNR